LKSRRRIRDAFAHAVYLHQSPIVSAKPAEHFGTGPGAYFHGMVAKAKAGDLHLNRAVWGLRSGSESARRSDPRRNRAASSPKTGYAERGE
jgi:hypothetical protein